MYDGCTKHRSGVLLAFRMYSISSVHGMLPFIFRRGALASAPAGRCTVLRQEDI